MRRDGEEPDFAFALEFKGGIEDGVGDGGAPIAEEEDVSVVIADAAEGTIETPAHQGRDAGVALYKEDDAVPMRAEMAKALGEGFPAEAAPIEVVHAVVEGKLHGFGRHAVAGGHAEWAAQQSGASESAGTEGNGHSRGNNFSRVG